MSEPSKSTGDTSIDILVAARERARAELALIPTNLDCTDEAKRVHRAIHWCNHKLAGELWSLTRPWIHRTDDEAARDKALAARIVTILGGEDTESVLEWFWY